MTAAGGYRRSGIGRAELFRALAELEPAAPRRDAPGPQLREMAALLGFAWRPVINNEPPSAPRAASGAGQATGPTSEPRQAAPPPLFPPVPFAYVRRVVEYPEPAAPEAPPAPEPELAAPAERRPPPHTPLTPWSRLWPRLRRALTVPVVRGPLDLPRVTRLIARGASLSRRLPRKPQSRWPSQVVVKLDRNPRLIPFYQDQYALLAQLRRSCGERGVVVHVHRAGLESPPVAQGGDRVQSLGGRDVPILALSDLGAYGSARDLAQWLRWGRGLRREGHRLVAVCPVPEPRMARDAAKVWNALPWEEPLASDWGVHDPEDARRKRVENLLQLLAFAVRIEPWTLRAARKALPRADADVGTEFDFWFHGDVIGSMSLAVCPNQERARRWKQLAALTGERQRQLARVALAVVDAQQGTIGEEVVHDPVLRVVEAIPALRELGLAEAHDRAQAFLARLAADAQHPLRRASRFGAWTDRFRARWPEDLLHGDSAVGAAVQHLHAQAHPERRAKHYVLQQVADELCVVEHDVDLLAGGATLATFAALDARMELLPSGQAAGTRLDLTASPRIACDRLPCTLHTDRAELVLDVFEGVPRWAQALWRDDQGLWARVAIGDTKLEILSGPTAAAVYCPRCGAENPATRRFCSTCGDTLRSRPGEPVVLAGAWARTERGAAAPEWVSDFGVDDCGLWIEFEFETVRQRMRYIPPGSFTMGSPAEEAGRFEAEGPQHAVTLTQGYFLADTPCTQALWEAVMGKNPSHFSGATRPVEQVSFEDCQRFVERLNGNLPGLDLRLPTEAEWEYACRAGTETATYGGELDIDDQGFASGLDPLAWYGHNGDGETHPVGEKRANAWGLYDMLGNVDEWCADGMREYSDQPITDPEGPMGPSRVVRGGAWFDLAGYVRAAYRFESDPGYRNFYLGFRFARGQSQESAEPTLGQAPAEPVAHSTPAELGSAQEAEPTALGRTPIARPLGRNRGED